MGAKVTHEIHSDWFGQRLEPPVQYSLSVDAHAVSFEASRQESAQLRPNSKEGQFCPELWRFDVAELFLADLSGKPYLEVNLAPNGAWWMCWFHDVRLPQEKQPAFTGVEAAGCCQKKAWNARIRIPHSLLPPLESLSYNITFILNSPQQTFHSLAPLPGKEPDFHQPSSFLSLSQSLPS